MPPLIQLTPIAPGSLAHHINVQQFPKSPNAFQAVLQECVDACPAGVPHLLQDTLQALREHNAQQLAQNDASTVGLILDGRKQVKKRGFFGDAVEASRVVRTIAAPERHVRVITPDADVFTQTLEHVQTVPVLANIPMTWKSPCNCGNASSSRYHKAVKEAAGLDRLVAAPNICMFPYWFGGSASRPNNLPVELPEEFIARKNGCVQFVNKRFWTIDDILNQVHAHQLWLYLLGAIDAPVPICPPFLVDNPHLAIEEVMSLQVAQTDRVIMIHIGTDGERVKYWCRDRWKSLIDGIAVDFPGHRVCFLWPANPDRQDDTQCLINYAIAEKHLAPIQFPKKLSLQRFILVLRSVIGFFDTTPILVGVDSLSAGHLYPALGGRSVVIGNNQRDDFHFSCPGSPGSMLVLPPGNEEAADQIPASEVLLAIAELEN
jgi:hypothetical protein